MAVLAQRYFAVYQRGGHDEDNVDHEFETEDDEDDGVTSLNPVSINRHFGA